MSFALRPLDLMELIDETVKADEGIGFTTGKGKATTFYFFLPECSEPVTWAP